jgi:hypothetical protein
MGCALNIAAAWIKKLILLPLEIDTGMRTAVYVCRHEFTTTNDKQLC